MNPTTQRIVRNIARAAWRRLPAGHDMRDIEQEAMLGALKAPPGCQARGAKFAIIHYLRREYPGSRSGRPARWFQLDGDRIMTRPTQERRVIDADERARVLAAVDALSAEELAAIRAVFFEGLTQGEYAARCGRSVSSVQRLQYKALGRLRRRLAA